MVNTTVEADVICALSIVKISTRLVSSTVSP
jgi:hypothetical protein